MEEGGGGGGGGAEGRGGAAAAADAAGRGAGGGGGRGGGRVAAMHVDLGYPEPPPLGAPHDLPPPPKPILRKQPSSAATFGSSAKHLLASLGSSFKDLAALPGSYLLSKKKRHAADPAAPAPEGSAAAVTARAAAATARPLSSSPSSSRSPLSERGRGEERVDPVAGRFREDASVQRQRGGGGGAFETEGARIMGGGGGGGGGGGEWVHTLSAEGQRKQQRLAELQRQRREAQEAANNNHLPTGARSAPKGIAFDC